MYKAPTLLVRVVPVGCLITLALTDPSELVIILFSNVAISATVEPTLALAIGKQALPVPDRNIELTVLFTLSGVRMILYNF